MPPFGHTSQLRVFVDPDLLKYDGAIDFVRVAGGVITDIKNVG